VAGLNQFETTLPLDNFESPNSNTEINGLA
jgi:hypothetical protein